MTSIRRVVGRRPVMFMSFERRCLFLVASLILFVIALVQIGRPLGCTGTELVRIVGINFLIENRIGP